MSSAIVYPTFSGPKGAAKKKGPHARIRLEGEVMREVPGGPVIAKHADHAWIVDGERYTRLDCDCRVKVHFERVDGTKSKKFGPFSNFSFVDGIAYADREVFAFADRAMVDWYCHADDHHWPLMIIDPEPEAK
jgi:hypothetical protein